MESKYLGIRYEEPVRSGSCRDSIEGPPILCPLQVSSTVQSNIESRIARRASRDLKLSSNMAMARLLLKSQQWKN